MKAVIEVGANTGNDTKKLLEKYKDCTLISFEPVPDLYNELVERYKDNKRVILYNCAVSDKDGNQKFNITKTDPSIRARYGSSSLYEFKKDLHNKWSRPDFYTEKTIDIKVVKLSDIIQSHGIKEVEFLHCDAQGNDLNVLKGLRRYSEIVKAGVIEVTDKISLYEGSQNTIEEARKILPTLGFEIIDIKKNDKKEAEANISFRKLQ